MSKKFVNKLEETVDDALFGLVSSNKDVELCKNSNRVVHLSQLDLKTVSLIAGGGSGHEPYAAGYVGKGLLTAAVAGNVFASPPSRNVQAALEVTKGEAGAILFVINYTGDRLNFGLAAERFNASGGNAKVVTIADDLAIDNPNSRVGRRGLAGAVLTIKIAGAMSEEGKSLDEIYEMSQKVVKSLGTLGVSLYPGSLPGKNRETELPNDQIEVGLGIHGEPGKFRAPYECAHKIITGLMGTIQVKMEMKKSEKFVVLVNNLGSVSQLEMGIVNGEVLRWFADQKIEITRFYSGTYMTSLDGHGISVTVMRVDDLMIRYLDAPATAPGWIPSFSVGEVREVTREPSEARHITEISSSGISLNAELVRGCLDGVVKSMLDSEDELNKLDAEAGDGDCGSTFAGAARAIQASQKAKELDFEQPETLLKQLSVIFEQTVGGTSGALYALMFSSAAQEFHDNVDSNTILEALKKANQAVQKYGGARVGERTMVDSLDAMVEELSKGLKENQGLDVFERAVQASERAAEDTANQKASVGRASYTSSESQTKPDAGATAISLWLRAFWTAFKQEMGKK
ncbi:hypothetical protein GCK72_019051 [Caenorhabditis remanei]|uniref:Triokinase/FMN cyclase n=1 Tax=Caenorhabditis remanei TaxID=31234 RepID=A0A6A5GCB2_CAERE|nr:hypothetical protein GCK72_019051 [Caenorhabditis remanei]KAF1752496.1 hypothetical protein GCK72_019051 [Caenorhabditis remanei]